MFIVSACQKVPETTTTITTEESTRREELPTRTSNKNRALPNQQLRIAQVSNADFQGVFSPTFSRNTLEEAFFAPTEERLFAYDKKMRVTSGIATIAVDRERKQVSISLPTHLKWSDGQQVIAEDVIFPYEVIGHKDYSGIRYNEQMENIVGMKEYHEGKADYISGIEKVNDQQIRITYERFTASLLQSDEGIWPYAMPKHAFEGIEVKEMEQSKVIREHPVTFGPYTISKVLPGSSVEYVPNPYYYGGVPKLTKIVMEKISVEEAVTSLEAGEFDIYEGLPNTYYASWEKLSGYELIRKPQIVYNYLGFKMGTYNAEKGKNEYDDQAKMANQNLRRAMGFAIDNDLTAQQFYGGFQKRANSLIVPSFSSLYYDGLDGFIYNPTKAKQLLDLAGYTDRNGDGFREDPDGNRLTINFAFRDLGSAENAIAEYYIQAWKKVGLRVSLIDHAPIESTNFYQMLEEDDPRVDIYYGGWAISYDPDPTSLYGEKSALNYTRFVSAENNELLAEMQGLTSFQSKRAIEVYQKWQEYMTQEAVVIPTTYYTQIISVAKNVTGYDVSVDVDHNPYAVLGITSENLTPR